MKGTELERDIVRGKELFTEIVRVTSDFLARFEAAGPAEIRAFEERRQELLEELLAFQSGMRQRLAGGEKELSLAMAKQLDEFKIFREVFIQIIMEKNAAIISLASQSSARLRQELDAICRGRRAMRGYHRYRGQYRNFPEQTA